MRLGKFLLLLFLVFGAAFYWADSNVKQTPSSSAISIDDDASFFHRVYRVFALKKEINAKVSKVNYTRIKDIPLVLQQSIIAVEDNRFYHHYGFDIEGILRAMLVNLQRGEVEEGGSTITQQLVKNLFLTHERTWGRKLEEVILSIDMELRYSKEEILELYLNSIYFGSGATGIADAAKIYFDKPPSELNLAESTMLAGLPNAPSLYSPYVDFAAAKQRQAVVLSVLVKHGYIGPSTADEAKTARLRLAK
ncbi:MAG: Peptidoglycan glycosyltransferase [Firmicutes bacterium]|nr:Peptidoglycan glycosyltransferase [Bacillota bacterium]